MEERQELFLSLFLGSNDARGYEKKLLISGRLSY